MFLQTIMILQQKCKNRILKSLIMMDKYSL